ncbi:hypothetical protein tb265_00340 [Gemmatimonadetes bacterium T265]|nr:hypothetical protein tb265_00340 [Gemmatimonadetes bacterium T265]
MRRLALAAALLLAPTLAPAQGGGYHFANGTLYADGPFSADGCGRYVCLGLTAGAGGDGIAVAVTRATTTAAYAALGARAYTFVLADAVWWSACESGRPDAACSTGGGDYALQGFSSGPYLTQTFGVDPVDYGTYNTYALWVRAPVAFQALDAAGRVIATDAFAPSLVVTPEPSALALTLGGLAVLGAAGARRRRDA